MILSRVTCEDTGVINKVTLRYIKISVVYKIQQRDGERDEGSGQKSWLEVKEDEVRSGCLILIIGFALYNIGAMYSVRIRQVTGPVTTWRACHYLTTVDRWNNDRK